MNKKVLQLSLLFLLVFSCNFAFSQALSVTMSTTPACSLDGTVTATVTGGVPPYTYSWYGPNGPLAATGNTVSGSGGYYQVSVTDQVTATTWGYDLIPFPFQISASSTPDVCNTGVGSATATVTSGGTPPFTYLWSNGATTQTASNLTAGSYELTVTDALGCFITSDMDSMFSAFVYNTSPITATVTRTNSLCNDGTATISNVTGGTAPYTYFWNSVPPQFTATATNLSVGSYTVRAVDATGCDYYGYVYIGQLANGIVLTETHTDETCIQANGTASVSASGGQAPYTYNWSNGATTQSITGLSYGHYAVTVTDNLGCPRVKQLYIRRTDPLTLSFTNVNPGCSQNNGSATINVTGGTPPYTYLWNNGATTQTASNLSIGYNSVTVTDANGCYDHLYTVLTYSPSCYATISGKLSIDPNMNCTFDGGDYGFPNQVISLGSTYAITDQNGNFSKSVLPGSYVVSQPTPPTYYAQECPNANGVYNLPSVLAGSAHPGNDFFDTTTVVVNDLVITFWCTAARATANQNVYITVRNVGSNVLNPTATFTHDALMSFVSASGGLSSYTLATRTLAYNVGTLNPGSSRNFSASFSIPSLTAVGTAFTHSAEVQPVAGDANPSDNVYAYSGMTVGAYDPNRKSVYPDGDIPVGDAYLNYVIEFQNTGNDTAFTVELRDTLDGDLDIATIEIIGASHNYTWDINGLNSLRFTFANIMLPDSFINEPLSHGYVAYRIRTKDNLPLGTRVENTAAIYFDYNAPIITNTTLNTVTGPVATDLAFENAGFKLFPNPAHDRVSIQLEGEWYGETHLELRDLQGRVVKSGAFEAGRGENAKLSLTGLPAGIYLLRCSNGTQSAVQKLVIQ